MTDLIRQIENARVRAAEAAVVASIPAELRENAQRAEKRFAAAGGCPGCKSMHIGVHHGDCPTLAEPDFY